MGLNLSIGILTKETKTEKIDDYRYKIITWSNEDEPDNDKGEFQVSLERSISYGVLNEIIGDYNYISNDPGLIEIDGDDVCFEEHGKEMKMDGSGVGGYGKYNEGAEGILKELRSATNLYEFATVMKKYNMQGTGL